MYRRCCLLLLLLFRLDLLSAWESYELDLFDLVEEIGLNKNFYDFIGIEKSAELAEIKKAYRKLSLLWHPDKSDDPQAEQKFRQLVGVYEILKDDHRRARYDRILVEGLPKWNQPIYYFRRAKKLRLWEIFTILTVIITIGHYLVLWAIYFESTLTMNERLNDARKRIERKMKKTTKGKDFDQTLIDEEIARTLPALQSPHFTDLLPIKFANFLVDHQFFLPHLKNLPKILLEKFRPKPEIIEPEDLLNDEEEEKKRIKAMKSPVIRNVDIVPEMATRRAAPVVPYLITNNSSNDDYQSDSRDSHRPWTDDEKQLLCKTIVRFPPGTPRRWEKIAEVVGRHVTQVTEMAKKIQGSVGTTVPISSENQSSISSSNNVIDENIITERVQCQSTTDWSQTDQHLLECALKNIPKDTPGIDRWEQISRCIPGKTRDECLARYRHIVQLVRAKKTV